MLFACTFNNPWYYQHVKSIASLWQRVERRLSLWLKIEWLCILMSLKIFSCVCVFPICVVPICLFLCWGVTGHGMHCQAMGEQAAPSWNENLICNPYNILHLRVSFLEDPVSGRMPLFIVICRSALDILDTKLVSQTLLKLEEKLSFFSNLIWFQPCPLDGRSWISDPTT